MLMNAAEMENNAAVIFAAFTNQGRLRISFNANTIRLHYELNYDLILIEPNKMLFLAVSHIAYPTASDSFSYLLIWNED